MMIKGVRNEIKNVNPYIAGKTIDEVRAIYNLKEIIKLGSNENAYGPFEHAKKAMINEIGNVFMYPDKTYEELKSILADQYKVEANQLAIAHGAGGMLETLARTFIAKGDEVIIPEQTYGLYFEITKLMGGTVITVPLDENYCIPVDEMIKKINDKTKIIWLCNPNNPTGTVVDKEAFNRLLAALKPHTWLVLDEAYAEFAEQNALPDAIKKISEGHNLIVVRTFSKAYALAGVRIGYAIANKDMIKLIDTVAEPFNANRVGLVGAIASLKEDQKEYQTSLNAIIKDRKMLSEALSKFNFKGIHSHANFIFCETPYNAEELSERLLKKGIIIRPCGGWGYPNAIRISVSTTYENQKFLETLEKVLNQWQAESEE